MQKNCRQCRLLKIASPLYMLFYLILSVFLLSSCGITKPSLYFNTLQRDTALQNLVTKDFEAKIRKNDVLDILITSSNPIEDALYNASALKGYIVDMDGNIQIHNLGLLHVEGSTRRELKNKIQTDLKTYLKDPIVNINYLNHHVTVLGEVKTPQVVEMKEDQQALVDVLAFCGDISFLGAKTNVLIVRDSANMKIFKRINLENHSIFTSDSSWYYLKSNDIVYVEKDNNRVDKTEKRQVITQTLGIGVSVVTLTLLILDRIFK